MEIQLIQTDINQQLKKFVTLIKKNGLIYIMVPVGKPGVEFNSHRVFDPTEMIIILMNLIVNLIKFSFS